MNRRDIRIIGVVGTGRCGTSMVCQMLEQAMFPMTGEYPTFEAEETLRADHARWLERLPNHVIKWIGPTCNRMPPMPEGFNYKLIFVKRKDRRAQALSQLKMTRMALGPHGKVEDGPVGVFRMKSALATDESQTYDHIIKVAGKNNILPLIFENVLSDPDLAARRICAFLLIPQDYAPGMARAVRTRSPDNYDGFLETELIEERLRLEKNGATV